MKKRFFSLLLVVSMMASIFLFTTGTVSADSEGAYLLAYTKELGTTASNLNYMSFYDDSLHLAYSRDGENWTELNDNKGILFYSHSSAYTNANAKQYRHPFIFQKKDGTYGLLATTVRYNGNVQDTTINYWDSTDLLNWENQRLITLSTSGIYPQYPQAKYDPDNDNYMIIWKHDGKVYYNTIDDTFTTAGASKHAEYSGTDYPLAIPSDVNINNAPPNSLLGSVIKVTEAELDYLIAHIGTPRIPQGTKEVNVTTIVGQAPELPDMGTIYLSDGTSEERDVNWEPIDPESYSRPGTYTVTGLLDGAPNYQNPINKNGADPCIYRGPDKSYYYTSSYMDYENNGIGAYQYDRIIIRKAETIQGLATAEERTVFWRNESGPASYHIWAPEIHYVQFNGEEEGTWVIYFAGSRADSIWALRVFALVCDSQDPMTGNWSLQKIEGIDNETFDLDATVFKHNNEWYMAWAHKPGADSNITIAKMNDLTTLGANSTIAVPEYTWERRKDRVLEGLTVMKKNGKIFMSFAAGSTDTTYVLGMLTAEDSPDTDLLDPSSWTKTAYPLMIADSENQQFGTGHATFTVAEDGETILLSYHARPNERYSGVGGYNPLYDATRYARVAVVYWHEAGTPYFGIPSKDGYLPGSAVTATVTVVEDPIEQITGLKQSVAGLDVVRGIKNSLTVKLDQALELFQTNKHNSVNVLNAFINQVSSLRDEGVLTEEQAAELIKAAEEVILNITSLS